VLQCVAVCCSMLQCVAVRSVVAECCSVLQCVAVCCSVLQCPLRQDVAKNDSTCVCCVTACCSMLQCVAVCSIDAECCSVLQCVAVYCSVLQWPSRQASPRMTLFSPIVAYRSVFQFISFLQSVAECCSARRGRALPRTPRLITCCKKRSGHCNTLQHTATHCTTLHHTATHTCSDDVL